MPSPGGNALVRAAGYSLAVLCIGVPVLYVSYCETVRHSELRRRRERFESRRTARERRRLGKVTVAASAGDAPEEGADGEKGEVEVVPLLETAEENEEEEEDLRQLYKSVRIGGRYANPFPEWREQVGAWEWLAWKLFVQPCTGRFMWTGGVPKSSQVLADSLPVEEPNWELLFGPSTVSPQGSTGSGVAGTGSQKSDDGTGLADSWDHLSQPSLSDPPSSPSSSTEALLAPPTSLYIAHPRRQIRVSPKLTFTWIGQSTSFIQLEGVGILTDPVFSHKTIDSFLAPPRLCPCPCTLASLLSIQIVLVSHSHLDHLSPDVVVALGSSVEWVVPLGMRQWFRNLGVVDAKIHDLDWWESVELKVAVPGDGEGEETRKLNVTSTAAMHWSARSPLDTNQSLWSSYVVKGERDSYFHCGDTGYSEGLFKGIGRLFGPITLATLPIGAYHPRWHLAPVHMSPDDAVKVHRDIGSKLSIGVHHSTWCLSDEHYLEPPKDLALARVAHGLTDDEFCVVPQGRTIVVASSASS